MVIQTIYSYKSEMFVCETFVRFIEKSKTGTDFGRSGKSCYIKWSCVYLYVMSRLICIFSLLVTRVNR